MGRAARLNPRANGTVEPKGGARNPPKVRLMQQGINTLDVARIHARGARARFAFSDRAYTMDPNGVLRRAAFFGLKTAPSSGARA